MKTIMMIEKKSMIHIIFKKKIQNEYDYLSNNNKNSIDNTIKSS